MEYSREQFKQIHDFLSDVNSMPAVVDIQELNKLGYVYNQLKNINVDNSWDISTVKHQPFKFSGAVVCTFKKLSTNATDAIADLIELSDVFEICPLANGETEMSFCFDHLTSPIYFKYHE